MPKVNQVERGPLGDSSNLNLSRMEYMVARAFTRMHSVVFDCHYEAIVSALPLKTIRTGKIDDVSILSSGLPSILDALTPHYGAVESTHCQAETTTLIHDRSSP